MALPGSLLPLFVALLFGAIYFSDNADAAATLTSRRGLASTAPEQPPDASPPPDVSPPQHVSPTTQGCAYILSTALYVVFYEQKNTSGTVPCCTL